jgi:hypothetical protein
MVKCGIIMRMSEVPQSAAAGGLALNDGVKPDPPRHGERRRVERALADLRQQIASTPRDQFYGSIAYSLAELADVDCAFIARLSEEPAPTLQTLAFQGRGAANPVFAPGTSGALPDALFDSLREAGPDQDLNGWLRESGWLRQINAVGLMTHPLLGCDASLIGLIGIADKSPLSASDDRHIRTAVESFARLAERVLERDNTVAALNRDRSQLAAIIDSAMDAIVSIDDQQRIVRFNDAAERMFQRSAAEVIGQSLELLLPPDVHNSHHEYVKNFARVGATFRRAGALGEVRGARADGTGFPAEISISRVNSGNGSEYTAIVRDITESKRALEQLTAAETKFRSLVEQSLAGIFIVQAQRFRYVNPYLAQMFGCDSPLELLDRIPLAELIVPTQRARVTAQVRECLAGRRGQVREEFRVLRRDGRVIQVELHGQEFEFDGRPALIGVVLDVTDRSRTEEALRQSEQLFRSMFEAMNEGVAVYDFVHEAGQIVDYQVVDVNPAYERHTGIGVTHARGKRASELYQTRPTPFLDRYLPIAGGGQPVAFEAYLEPLHRRFSVSAFSIGRSRFVSVFQDVTEQRRMEQEDRERAQQLSRTGGLLTLGEMASTLAHELNQPLTSIANFSAGSLARIEGENATLAGLREILEVIGEEADRAGKILNGVRKFMEKRDFNPAPIDVNELVHEVVGLTEILNHDERISLQLDLGSALPPVLADRVLIQVVLVNLIRNGIEAMQEAGGGPSELRVRTVDVGPSQIETSVSDTGCGLPGQEADDVFRAFFTTKSNGLGLGLAIARSIVESHGGRIWATRNGDRGTTFHFTLKTAGAPAP